MVAESNRDKGTHTYGIWVFVGSAGSLAGSRSGSVAGGEDTFTAAPAESGLLESLRLMGDD
jgi:hypothetical protein